jgi:hypothetical protein
MERTEWWQGITDDGTGGHTRLPGNGWGQWQARKKDVAGQQLPLAGGYDVERPSLEQRFRQFIPLPCRQSSPPGSMPMEMPSPALLVLLLKNGNGSEHRPTSSRLQPWSSAVTMLSMAAYLPSCLDLLCLIALALHLRREACSALAPYLSVPLCLQFSLCA